jgi:hypothetical protein
MGGNPIRTVELEGEKKKAAKKARPRGRRDDDGNG